MLKRPISRIYNTKQAVEQVTSVHRSGFADTAQIIPLRRCNRTGARLFSTTTSIASTKPSKYGQPLHRSHPERIRPHELTRGIKPEEYESRRKKLMASLPEGSVVVCMGGTVRLVTQTIFYKFRQGTDFFYLTGFDEADATVVLESRPSTSKGYKYTLFVPPQDSRDEVWNGSRTCLNDLVQIFGADEAKTNDSLSPYLSTVLRETNVYASLPPSPSTSKSSQPFHPPSPKRRSSLLKLFTPSAFTSTSDTTPAWNDRDPPHLLVAAALAGERAKPLEREMQKIRVVKSKAELGLMKIAADISAEGHTKVMRYAKPGMDEAALQAVFEYHCALERSERPAYVPVVASGANALTIHYTRNDCTIDDGDLVLIDAGCEVSMYASDITRTFPANGKFTSPQRDLYEVVLSVQKSLIKKCTIEESISMYELQRITCSSLTDELKQIGIKTSPEMLKNTLYSHFISHHLGSDLHDCPTIDRGLPLIEGNVITVEPGLYIPPDPAYPKHFHNLGIRIEDDVAITKDGPYILTANAPKEISDVEAVCQGILDR